MLEPLSYSSITEQLFYYLEPQVFPCLTYLLTVLADSFLVHDRTDMIIDERMQLNVRIDDRSIHRRDTLLGHIVEKHLVRNNS